jgi:glutathione S-transferase
MQDQLTLFSYRRCPFAIRVRLALHEKGLGFSVKEEDLKNKSEDLLRLHPEARVPLLVDRGFVVFESSAITEYIDEAFEGPRLMPNDPRLKAEVRMWTVWCNHLFKTDIDKLKYGKTPDIVEVGKVSLQSHLAKLESLLLHSDWIVGNQFSLADIHIFPFFRQLERIKPDFLEPKSFPRLFSWFERICDRPSFEATMRKTA